ncbi:zinc-binding dehydrogenase [Geomonas sp. RF6]|uniref:quinone oxidoreductase family protein n=1 Tax=Geomonas sp. RF6 TaxID=2897342 RepID=UPI001E486EB8|nr:zinc-binding dehydrogenase [Geomonas sp. RF6]UFS71239.1 zinc-binding dehydrogenase [Geomonas sp. RF6]
MFAVYADHGDSENPLAALRMGERPEPHVPEGWVRVKVTHASLNRHDIFTLQGVTAHPQGLTFPIILGSDGAGLLDDGAPVVIYPVLGSDDWRDDETLDPHWHIVSEFVPGTFADYLAVPKRNAVPVPEGLSLLDASVLGTAWLTAYRALFTKSGLRPGETLLVQGASGGMSTALIQLGRAAGFEVWVTSRTAEGRELAERIGASRSFDSNERLPRKVQAVVDNVGPASWEHTFASVARGGTIVVTGGTTGFEVPLHIIPVLLDQITVCGSIMGTLQDMKNMMKLMAASGIKPEIGQILPMEQAEEGFRSMWLGKTSGKVVFVR